MNVSKGMGKCRPGRGLMLVLALALMGAHAPEAGAEQDPARAKELYNAARQLHDAGRVRESLDKLREAYDAYPSDAILISIANRHLDLGEPEEAAAVLSQIQPASSKIRRQVSRLRKDVEAKLAEPVTASISADARGAEVSIDGGPFRKLPAKVQLPRGSHRFVVRAPGRREITLTEDLKGSIEVPLVVGLPDAVGYWRVALDPPEKLDGVQLHLEGQRVEMSGEELMKSVTDARKVRPGSYTLTCVRKFEDHAQARVDVTAGDTVVATCRFPPKPVRSGHSPWAWASAGAAAAALGGGTYYLVSYLGEKKDFPAPRYDIESTKPLASGMLFATGVGFGVLSAFLFAD